MRAPRQRSRRPARTDRLPWGALVALTLLCAACREAPEAIYEQARDALAAEDVEGFASLLVPNAAQVVRRAPAVQASSRKRFSALGGKLSPRLLPPGDIEERRVAGARCVLTVVDGDDEVDVPLLLVDGRWRIDLFALPTWREVVGVED